ncbi:MAG: threonine synthase [Aestuariivita sp.]|nr:threonine synthase [Aestuariivita sp.]MCY4204059.1 threonine synthase [Aestuariivita sp.]
MEYVSTRGGAPELDFRATMFAGLAPDGGLYVPKTIPRLKQKTIAALAGQSFEDIALRVITPFIGDSFSEETLRRCIQDAYDKFDHPARAPLVQIGQNHWLLELFHGPTLAFKDFAMQLIAQLFRVALRDRQQQIMVIGATSGDTGSAAIEAFRGIENTEVFVLFPHGRISDIQRLQMTTPSEKNVHALAVDGDFDDCQALVKAMFNDRKFRNEMRLVAMNSINWARILVQIVYYFSSAVRIGAPHRTLSYAVPTGNFGDIFAGFIAKSMGLPIKKLVVATNQNDILHRCLTGQGYFRGETRPSISPSMDIQVASNFERALYYAYGCSGSAIAELMDLFSQRGVEIDETALDSLVGVYGSGRVSEDETRATISKYQRKTGELLCPHSAIGVRVGEQWQERSVPMISLATAHPAKFVEAVEDSSGQCPTLPSRIADLHTRTERVCRVKNDLTEIQNYIGSIRDK